MEVKQLGRLLFAGLAVAAICGCDRPRFKGVEAWHTAVTTDPAPTAPPDVYGFSTMADGSGGRNIGSSYGSGANDIYDGDPSVYDLETQQEKNALSAEDKSILYGGVPDPRLADKHVRFQGSDYFPSDGQ